MDARHKAENEKKCRIFLTAVGNERLAPLLTAAKSNEADALGNFNADEANALKGFLRRIIEWTALQDVTQ